MGRKRKFSEEEIARMQRMRDAGESVGDIARAYGTNARMVYEYTDSKTPNDATRDAWDEVRLYVLDGLRKAMVIKNETNGNMA